MKDYALICHSERLSDIVPRAADLSNAINKVFEDEKASLGEAIVALSLICRQAAQARAQTLPEFWADLEGLLSEISEKPVEELDQGGRHVFFKGEWHKTEKE